MGSILNFISENTDGTGLNLKNKYENMLFKKSVFGNYLDTSNLSKTTNFEVKDGHKNILYLECNTGLHDFYTPDEKTGKTILENLPKRIKVQLHSNRDVKLLLTSLSEATDYQEEIIENIKSELSRFLIPLDKLIIMDSNNIFPKMDFGIKCYTPYHFLNDGNNPEGNITDLNYIFKDIKNSDIDLNKKRKYHFLCFNRNTQKYHRHFLILFLYKHNLLDKTILSALRELGDVFDDELNYLNEYKDEINEKIPIEVDTHFLKNKMQFRTIDAIRKVDYLKSYIHLVPETIFEQNAIFFTEKIVKPIRGIQPFIVLSQHNYLKELRKQGFKTFHPIIDESYDDEPDNTKRLKKIFKEILRLSEMSIDDIHNLYKSVIDICIYNKRHLEKISKTSPLNEIVNRIENEW